MPSNCLTCGSEMNRRRGVKYCSTPCQPWKSKDYTNRAEVECTWCGKRCNRELRDDHSPVCSTTCRGYLTSYRNGNNVSAWPVGRNCMECGEFYKTTSHRNGRCTECLEKYWESKRVHKDPVKRFVSAQCPRCGQWWIGDRHAGSNQEKYCSNKCSHSDGKDRRRARQKNAFGAHVSRHKIYQRDKWICHLCGRKVQRSQQVPHPLAPTIDHLIPLARGGTHEPANVATAHFQCNSIKGARGGGEQLALIG